MVKQPVGGTEGAAPSVTAGQQLTLPCDSVLLYYIAAKHGRAGSMMAGHLAQTTRISGTAPLGLGHAAAAHGHHARLLPSGCRSGPARPPEIGLITEFHCSTGDSHIMLSQSNHRKRERA